MAVVFIQAATIQAVAAVEVSAAALAAVTIPEGITTAALDEKAEFLKHDYYTNCPKCGAARAEDKDVCSFCGTSLIIEKKAKK